MTCRACLLAEKEPRSGMVEAKCPGCLARVVAALGYLGEPDYPETMEALFGRGWATADLDVREWSAKIRQHEVSH